MQPVADRAAQFLALLVAITAARKAGDDLAREDAEGALSLLLRGHTIEMTDPTAYAARALFEALLNEMVHEGDTAGYTDLPEDDALPLILSALRAAEARGKVQGLREAAEMLGGLICSRTCGHDHCAARRLAQRDIRERADAIEQETSK